MKRLIPFLILGAVFLTVQIQPVAFAQETTKTAPAKSKLKKVKEKMSKEKTAATEKLKSTEAKGTAVKEKMKGKAAKMKETGTSMAPP